MSNTETFITIDSVRVPTFLYGTAWKEDETERLTREAMAAGFAGIDTANQRRHYHWLRGWHFEAIANADEKGRYQVENGMIRATYGHSIELDLDLPTDDIPEALYYPCESGEVETLLEFGLTAGDRKNVHLSRSIQNAMEAGHVRIDRPIILEIDTSRAIADGHVIYRAGTTVFLTDEVPGEYLYKVDEDDPMILETIEQWELEEEE